jgi:uncharacterized protein (DUF885 family)
VVPRAARGAAGEDLVEAGLSVAAVRALADRYLHELAALDPVLATGLGLAGHDHRLTDYSPDAQDERASLARRTLVELDGTTVGDDADRSCALLLRDRLGTAVALHDAGEGLRPLRVIGSPVGSLRGAFDGMAHATPDDWEIVAARLEAVPAAYRSLLAALDHGRATGVMAARRQAEANAAQVATWAGLDGGRPWFVGFVADGPEALRSRLDEAAVAATDVLRHVHDALVDYAARAPEVDAVGADRYALFARQFLGADLDATAAYGWAWDELDRIEADMRDTAAMIVPGGGIDTANAWLDEHGRAIEGVDALQAYLQDLMDSTIAALDGTHMTLDPRVRKVEAMIAPPGTAAAQYYTPPSADFSRPGRTWYPTMGAERFPVWGEVSTCYHEGVPGHHLQLAQWRVEGDRLSHYQTMVSVSGNIEGWALYAERLMDELGFLGDPGDRFGYLVAQQLRATRVIVDIGMHLGLAIPGGQPFHPGQRWTADLGLEFLLAHAGKNEAFLRSEWVRYLGWPAQAISYKLGERVWLAGREGARRAAGDAFDLRAWHTKALAMGSLGLDDLAAALPTL